MPGWERHVFHIHFAERTRLLFPFISIKETTEVLKSGENNYWGFSRVSKQA